MYPVNASMLVTGLSVYDWEKEKGYIHGAVDPNLSQLQYTDYHDRVTGESPNRCCIITVHHAIIGDGLG